MGTKEYILLVLVIVIPLLIATIVTLWTLEQARLRSKKHRKSAKAKSDTTSSETGPVSS